MGNKFTLQDCIDLATFAHRHQYDKAGEPYINHPKRVLQGVQTQGAPAYVQMAAVLHDVTEDTEFTPEMLLTLGVPEAAVDIVRLVDRNLSAKKYDAIMDEAMVGKMTSAMDSKDSFYYFEIRKNPGAVIVKKADIGDNTQPWRLEYLSPDTQARLRAKYSNALQLLS